MGAARDHGQPLKMLKDNRPGLQGRLVVELHMARQSTTHSQSQTPVVANHRLHEV